MPFKTAWIRRDFDTYVQISFTLLRGGSYGFNSSNLFPDSDSILVSVSIPIRCRTSNSILN